MAALDLADYEPQSGAIVVRARKGNKDRRVYAPSGTIAALDAWQKMVGHESVTTTAGYDRRGDAAKCKAADLVHVPYFPRQA